MQPKVPSILRKQAFKNLSSKFVGFQQTPTNLTNILSASGILQSTPQDISTSQFKNTYNQSKIIQNIHNSDEQTLPKPKKIILRRKQSQKIRLSQQQESFSKNSTIKKQPIFHSLSPQKSSIFKSLQLSNKKDVKEQVEPIFRYCFLCQKSILEVNMDAHEIVCQNFEKLINRPQQQIMKILLDKITRIKCEIMDTMKVYNIQKFLKLEKSVESIINCCDKIQKSGFVNQEFEKSYQIIQNIYTSPEIKLLELSYKLRWFLKIREQMKNRFSI